MGLHDCIFIINGNMCYQRCTRIGITRKVSFKYPNFCFCFFEFNVLQFIGSGKIDEIGNNIFGHILYRKLEQVVADVA